MFYSSTCIIPVRPLGVDITGNVVTEANGFNELRLTCKTETANPVALIAWKNGGVTIGNTATVSHTSGEYGGRIAQQTLTLVPTRDMDGNRIVCEAWNTASVESRVTKIIQLNLTCKFHFISVVRILLLNLCGVYLKKSSFLCL